VPIVSVPGCSSARFFTAHGSEPAADDGAVAPLLAVPQAAAIRQMQRTTSDGTSLRMLDHTGGVEGRRSVQRYPDPGGCAVPNGFECYRLARCAPIRTRSSCGLNGFVM
jgi:hypothetical protein